MILVAFSPLVDKLLVWGFFFIVAVVFIVAMIDAQRLSVSWGGPTWKEWLRDLFDIFPKKNKTMDSIKSKETQIDEASLRTPPLPYPYSASEWNSSSLSPSSPTQTAAPSSDQASSGNVAALS